MRKNRLGFTLSEVLVSMVVLSLIVAMASYTVRAVKSSYTSLTYHAFNNVNILVSELISGQRAAVQKDQNGNKTKLPMPIVTCRKGPNGMLTNILAPDVLRSDGIHECIDSGYGVKAEVPSNLFCKHMVYYANTSGKTRCNSKDLFKVGFNDQRYEPVIKGVGAGWHKPNFVAINGQRYYISEWVTDKRVSKTYGFRIIAVDLNGKSGPNIIDNKNGSQFIPDIVQFLVLDNGEVFPIGVAGNNLTIKGFDNKIKNVLYLNTRIKGYNYRDDDSRTSNVPSSCFVKDKNGGRKQICNFGVVYLQSDEGQTFFSYKEAICGAFAGTSSLQYPEYCYRDMNKGGGEDSYITRNYLCPPSDDEQRFDQCDIKIVKPVFKYNLK